MFITFEGCEGAGKSTQINLLNQALQEKGYQTLVTKEPGGSPLCSKIRNLILNPDLEDPPSSMAELMLYIADRAHHVDTVILPALQSKKIVICDRYTDSTLAYQGYARGLELDTLKNLNRMATNNLKPDLTILLDIEPEQGMERIRKYRQHEKMDRLETEALSFHEKVRQGFLQISREEKERFIVLPARQEIGQLAKDILSEVLSGL